MDRSPSLPQGYCGSPLGVVAGEDESLQILPETPLERGDGMDGWAVQAVLLATEGHNDGLALGVSPGRELARWRGEDGRRATLVPPGHATTGHLHASFTRQPTQRCGRTG